MPKKRKANGLRRGPLTIEDKKYLEKNCHKDVEFLAGRIKRKPEAVQAFLDTIIDEERPQPESETQQAEPPKTMTRLPMGYHNKGTGVVTMNGTMSSVLDDIISSKERNNFNPKFMARK